ncbi:ATP-grasp domain-containing protein [Streptomyces sp. UNOC14_S4]|uniref:ATP-grasp domain-containing protein n=1 Tax=Streptomyces sp. UNOC14_S4 TaxID=2872340 RepID=UPI001E5BB2A3|nr:ATP-grasp domain-containing protein [Streptomyces sp. UNOC14_S4]MCC3772271.1 ATP-grasp domain-containing protein [Streptomyces sp. UNOC14_S4]
MTEPLPRPRTRVLVVEPLSSGSQLIVEARALGFELVVASHDRDDRRVADALREHIDELLVVDTNDEFALHEAVAERHRERPFAGIVPGFEFYVGTAARLAARLGLPGLPVDSVEALRDKAVMREAAEAAGLRVPRYAEATEAHELADAAAHVGFPAVLKPTRSAGSIHVTRVDTPDELRGAYERLRGDTRLDMGRDLTGPVLLEEYVAGPEVSVEGYVLDGQVTVVSVTSKLLGPEPCFVEVGMVVQHELEPPVRAAVEAYVTDVCRALGLTLGPFHCELRIPDGEPVLIEIGARLAGLCIPQLVELVTGVSLARVMLAAFTGLDPYAAGVFSAPRAKCAAVHCFSTEHGDGLPSFKGLSGLDELRSAEDVVEVSLYYPEGAEVPPAEDFRCLLGHVVFQAESHAGALARRAEIASAVRPL